MNNEQQLKKFEELIVLYDSGASNLNDFATELLPLLPSLFSSLKLSSCLGTEFGRIIQVLLELEVIRIPFISYFFQSAKMLSSNIVKGTLQEIELLLSQRRNMFMEIDEFERTVDSISDSLFSLKINTERDEHLVEFIIYLFGLVDSLDMRDVAIHLQKKLLKIPLIQTNNKNVDGEKGIDLLKYVTIFYESKFLNEDSFRSVLVGRIRKYFEDMNLRPLDDNIIGISRILIEMSQRYDTIEYMILMKTVLFSRKSQSVELYLTLFYMIERTVQFSTNVFKLVFEYLTGIYVSDSLMSTKDKNKKKKKKMEDEEDTDDDEEEEDSTKSGPVSIEKLTREDHLCGFFFAFQFLKQTSLWKYEQKTCNLVKHMIIKILELNEKVENQTTTSEDDDSSMRRRRSRSQRFLMEDEEEEKEESKVIRVEDIFCHFSEIDSIADSSLEIVFSFWFFSDVKVRSPIKNIDRGIWKKYRDLGKIILLHLFLKVPNIRVKIIESLFTVVFENVEVNSKLHGISVLEKIFQDVKYRHLFYSREFSSDHLKNFFEVMLQNFRLYCFKKGGVEKKKKKNNKKRNSINYSEATQEESTENSKEEQEQVEDALFVYPEGLSFKSICRIIVCFFHVLPFHQAFKDYVIITIKKLTAMGSTNREKQLALFCTCQILNFVMNEEGGEGTENNTSRNSSMVNLLKHVQKLMRRYPSFIRKKFSKYLCFIHPSVFAGSKNQEIRKILLEIIHPRIRKYFPSNRIYCGKQQQQSNGSSSTSTATSFLDFYFEKTEIGEDDESKTTYYFEKECISSLLMSYLHLSIVGENNINNNNNTNQSSITQFTRNIMSQLLDTDWVYNTIIQLDSPYESEKLQDFLIQFYSLFLVHKKYRDICSLKNNNQQQEQQQQIQKMRDEDDSNEEEEFDLIRFFNIYCVILRLRKKTISYRSFWGFTDLYRLLNGSKFERIPVSQAMNIFEECAKNLTHHLSRVFSDDDHKKKKKVLPKDEVGNEVIAIFSVQKITRILHIELVFAKRERLSIPDTKELWRITLRLLCVCLGKSNCDDHEHEKEKFCGMDYIPDIKDMEHVVKSELKFFDLISELRGHLILLIQELVEIGSGEDYLYDILREEIVLKQEEQEENSIMSDDDDDEEEEINNNKSLQKQEEEEVFQKLKKVEHKLGYFFSLLFYQEVKSHGKKAISKIETGSYLKLLESIAQKSSVDNEYHEYISCVIYKIMRIQRLVTSTIKRYLCFLFLGRVAHKDSKIWDYVDDIIEYVEEVDNKSSKKKKKNNNKKNKYIEDDDEEEETGEEDDDDILMKKKKKKKKKKEEHEQENLFFRNTVNKALFTRTITFALDFLKDIIQSYYRDRQVFRTSFNNVSKRLERLYKLTFSNPNSSSSSSMVVSCANSKPFSLLMGKTIWYYSRELFVWVKERDLDEKSDLKKIYRGMKLMKVVLEGSSSKRGMKRRSVFRGGGKKISSSNSTEYYHKILSTVNKFLTRLKGRKREFAGSKIYKKMIKLKVYPDDDDDDDEDEDKKKNMNRKRKRKTNISRKKKRKKSDSQTPRNNKKKRRKSKNPYIDKELKLGGGGDDEEDGFQDLEDWIVPTNDQMLSEVINQYLDIEENEQQQ